VFKANHLQGERGDRILFSNITFELEPGGLLLVTGPNGSGKSSLLKILAGLLPFSKGSITWDGRSIVSSGSIQRYSMQLTSYFSELLYIGHKTGIQPILTPAENLKWLLGIGNRGNEGNHSKALISSALQAVGLARYQDVPCEILSNGQRQRVALARLWLQPPKIWILDEPLTALDEDGQQLIQEQFLSHLKAGGLLITTTHDEILGKKFSQGMDRVKKTRLVLGEQRDICLC
jgi:heme exporter protein A